MKASISGYTNVFKGGLLVIAGCKSYLHSLYNILWGRKSTWFLFSLICFAGLRKFETTI